jgi:ribosomal protein L40E
MYELHETTTVAIKPCRSCGAGLIEASKFCRSCGAAQLQSLPPDSGLIIPPGSVEPDPVTHYATTRLSQQKLYIRSSCVKSQ